MYRCYRLSSHANYYVHSIYYVFISQPDDMKGNSDPKTNYMIRTCGFLKDSPQAEEEDDESFPVPYYYICFRSQNKHKSGPFTRHILSDLQQVFPPFSDECNKTTPRESNGLTSSPPPSAIRPAPDVHNITHLNLTQPQS